MLFLIIFLFLFSVPYQEYVTVFHKAVTSTSAEVLRFLIQKHKHDINVVNMVSFIINLIFPYANVCQAEKSAFSIALELNKPYMVSRIYLLVIFVLRYCYISGLHAF